MNRPAVLRHIESQVRCRRQAFRLRFNDALALTAYITRLEANQRPADLGERVKPPCTNHPDRTSTTNLDGDDLCPECADSWVRGEGLAAAEQDAGSRAERARGDQ